MADSSKPDLLTLPPEIRDYIYGLILCPDANRRLSDDEYAKYDYKDALALYRLNRQIYREARKVFLSLNVFVRITSPWPEATDHVAFEGHVPILIKGPLAARFKEYSLSVEIDAPHSPIQDAEPQFFIILLDDLENFAKTWFYADLSRPGLNRYLRLTLRIHDIYSPEWEEKRMPKWKQRQLLLPFGRVKDLGDMVIDGDPKPFASVEKELREAQSAPHMTPEECLSEAIRLKQEGNAELKQSRYRAALKLYTQAWEAIHVIVKGRQRHIHADAYYGRDLVGEPFEGKNGQAERLMLRVQLVANTTLAYLKLQEYEEARFWGMRSINLLRSAMGADERHDIPAEDEAVLGFPAADQMGRIYYRTAMAYKELGEKTQARKLLRVAAVYLPNDESVKKEISACALMLG